MFNDQEAYIGLSGAANGDGEVTYNLADGTYKIRADESGEQFWSGAVEIQAGAESAVEIRFD